MQISKEIATVRQALDAISGANPDAPFLVNAETGSTLSFLKVQEQSSRLSLMLYEAGLVRGDKVAFLMDNGLLTVRFLLGTIYGGLVAVPLNVRSGVMQLSHMLDDCDAKIVFVEERYATMLMDALAEVHRDVRVIAASADCPLPNFEPVSSAAWPPCPAADDAALLMYNSGGIGKPKAAIYTHRALLAHERNSIAPHQLDQDVERLGRLVKPFLEKSHENQICSEPATRQRPREFAAVSR